MKAQASAGRATCGVVRTATPVPRPRSRPCVTRVLAEASGRSRRLPVRPGAGQDVVVHRLQRRGDRMPRQLADHDDAEPAVREQRLGQGVARGAVGVGLGGVEAQRLVVGGRQVDELERGQRRAVALAADHQLLHRPAAGRGDAGEELARRRGGDVVDGDEFRVEVVELLLQRLGRRAGDEQLALVAADLPADLVLLAGEVVVLVGQELGRERGVRAGRGPRVGRFRRAGACAGGPIRLPLVVGARGSVARGTGRLPFLGAGRGAVPGWPATRRSLPSTRARRGSPASRRARAALAASPFEVSQANLPLPPELLIDGSRSGARRTACRRRHGDVARRSGSHRSGV